MRISIKDVNKTALYQKLENHVRTHHQQKELSEQNTAIYFLVITELSNTLINNSKTTEIDTQAFDAIYGAGVLEGYIKQQREEQSREVAAKIVATESKTVAESTQTDKNATTSISSKDKPEKKDRSKTRRKP